MLYNYFDFECAFVSLFCVLLLYSYIPNAINDVDIIYGSTTLLINEYTDLILENTISLLFVAIYMDNF